MDWSRIKTIFIIAFLILDLFLFSQLMTKTREFEVKSDASFEENLKADNISYKDLPKDIVNDTYMSANIKLFTEEETNVLKGQDVQLTDGSIIRAELKTPIDIKDKKDFSELNQFVKMNILFGNEYGFWDYEEEARTITYYQKVNNRLLFMNKNAQLVFYLNEDEEIDSYEQTMLETVKAISDKEEVLSALRALEAIYQKGEIDTDSKVKAELGYYTLVNMEATQVLTPTWHLVVENQDSKESFLVNAFEGQIIQAPTINEKILLE